MELVRKKSLHKKKTDYQLYGISNDSNSNYGMILFFHSKSESDESDG